MEHVIKSVLTKQELDAAYAFFKKVFIGEAVLENPEYAIERWAERAEVYGDLMLYAAFESEVIGIVFGRLSDKNSLIIGPVAVDENFRKLGIAMEMMLLLEERAKSHGVTLLRLGAVESAENFYKKLGYTGSLLIQSQIHSIEQLASLSTKHKHRVVFTDVYDGRVNQLCLELPRPDRELQRQYEAAFPGCYTQMIYEKVISGYSEST